MNIQEDLQREELMPPRRGCFSETVTACPPPREREVQFTEKCVTASRSFSAALLATSEMYTAAQYLSNHPEDDAYAKACREAILASEGLATLPAPPATKPECDAITSAPQQKASEQD